MLFVGDEMDPSPPRYVVMKYGAGGFSELTAITALQTPSSNFAMGRGLTPSGACRPVRAPLVGQATSR